MTLTHTQALKDIAEYARKIKKRKWIPHPEFKFEFEGVPFSATVTSANTAYVETRDNPKMFKSYGAELSGNAQVKRTPEGEWVIADKAFIKRRGGFMAANPTANMEAAFVIWFGKAIATQRDQFEANREMGRVSQEMHDLHSDATVVASAAEDPENHAAHTKAGRLWLCIERLAADLDAAKGASK